MNGSYMELSSDLVLRHKRKLFDRAVQAREYRLFRRGRSGRFPFTITREMDEEDRSDQISLNELERATVIEAAKRRFAGTYPLDVEYNLSDTIKVEAWLPVEYFQFFAKRREFSGIFRSVVSLLNPRYIGTAFRVTPRGGLLTALHNCSLTDPVEPPFEQLWAHESVFSTFAYAGNFKQEVVACEDNLPTMDLPDPCDSNTRASIYRTSDIAFLEYDHPGEFLIPYAQKLVADCGIFAVGYPGIVDRTIIDLTYSELPKEQRPTEEDYADLFTYNNLSVSPGQYLCGNNSVLACKYAATKGFSGGPICLIESPRHFIGVHFRGRNNRRHSLAVSVRDPGFYLLYSKRVIPILRSMRDELSPVDIEAINNYLRLGNTPLL